jgi:iron-sulfur cluster assembly protein
MTVQQHDPSAARITVTDAAYRHIKHYLEKQNGKAFVLSVKTTGCSGLQYDPQVVMEIDDTMVRVEGEPDLPIYLDSMQLDVLNGSTIDVAYKDLGQTELVYKNPNASGECGCGVSFSVD